MAEFETDYLAHHGIKGQKWGVRRTPEQLGHAPKDSKKKNSKIKDKIQDYKSSRKAKSRANLKEYLRDHPKQLPRFKRVITDEEAAEIIKKIEFDRKLEDIRDSEIQRSRDRFKSRAAHLQEMSNMAKSGKNLYNSSMAILDALIASGTIDPESLGPLVKNGKTIRIN